MNATVPKQPGSNDSAAEAPQPKKKGGCLKWGAIGAGLLIIIGLAASCGGDSDSGTNSATESNTMPDDREAEAPQSENEQSSALPNAWDRHEKCEPDDGTAAMITGVLNDSSLSVANGQLIRDGSDTWIGVSLIRPDGKMDARSDVWLLRDGGLYSVSNGAQNESWAVDAPGVSMADEYAAGVDRCVVAETMGK